MGAGIRFGAAGNQRAAPQKSLSRNLGGWLRPTPAARPARFGDPGQAATWIAVSQAEPQRRLLFVNVDAAGGWTARNGTAGPKMKAILDDIKPEAAYFTEFDGHRGDSSSWT
jgi:hypothetical protein